MPFGANWSALPIKVDSSHMTKPNPGGGVLLESLQPRPFFGEILPHPKLIMGADFSA